MKFSSYTFISKSTNEEIKMIPVFHWNLRKEKDLDDYFKFYNLFKKLYMGASGSSLVDNDKWNIVFYLPENDWNHKFWKKKVGRLKKLFEKHSIKEYKGEK